MSANPGPWRVVDGRDPELRQRFGRTTNLYLRSIKRRKRRAWLRLAIVFGAAFVVSIGMFALSPFTPVETIRHLGSFPNCDAARLMGLAPALKGEPGYWASHDADGDGVACEPWPPIVRTNW